MNDAVAGDQDLVERAQRGDRAALVALYHRYVSEIFGYLYNQVGDVHDAEDLTSETFLRLVRALDGFAGRSSFRTWIYEIARNQVRDHWRRNGRRPMATSLNGHERASADTQPGSEAHDAGMAEESDAVHLVPRQPLGQAILEALPANYRRVLELRIIDGRSVRHTAEELGKTEGNIKVLTHRALKRAEQIAIELGGAS
jgi:RNA polymerase sigma-70 factor (ECF subfamily)